MSAGAVSMLAGGRGGSKAWGAARAEAITLINRDLAAKGFDPLDSEQVACIIGADQVDALLEDVYHRVLGQPDTQARALLARGRAL